MLEVAQCYWADHNHKQAVAGINIKADVQKLRTPLINTVKTMKGMSREARRALNLEHARLHKKREVHLEDIFSDSLRSNEALLEALKLITARRYTRAASLAVKRACARLWKVREAVTGRPFVRSFEAFRASQTEKNLSGTQVAKGELTEFKHADAQFVLTALKGIDPEVTLSHVEDGLKRVAKEKPKEKQARKSA